MQSRLFHQYQDENGDEAACGRDRSETREESGREDDQRRRFGGSVDVMAAARHVRRRDDRDGSGQQNRGRRRDAGDPEHSAHAADRAEHGKRANPREACSGAVRMSRPLTFESDRGAAQCSDQDARDVTPRHFEKLMHWTDQGTSLDSIAQHETEMQPPYAGEDSQKGGLLENRHWLLVK